MRNNFFCIKASNGDYWNNSVGWTQYKSCATVFTLKEKNRFVNIPLGGMWISFN